MIFNTWEFGLFALLGVPLYWVTPIRWRVAAIVLLGLVFYSASGPRYTLLIVGLAAVTFLVGCALIGVGAERATLRRLLLTLGVAASVAALSYFKYTNFFLDAVTPICAACPSRIHPLVVPLALSFFTFEFVHFLVDVYLGKIRAVSFRPFAAFAMFFPTLVAGPIKRFQNFAPQLGEVQKISGLVVAAGVTRIAAGLAKKMIVADSMTPLTQPLLLPGPLYTHADYWIGILAYTAKIYFDFSGYSDIALGLSLLLGFELLENFDRPYRSANISEFWRRWHMSLSSWIRDYLFIPLGGSRAGTIRTVANLAVVMAIAGLWHGAAYHFMIWGLWHGAGLGVHRAWNLAGMGTRLKDFALVRPLSIATTFAFVAFGWVLFASPTLAAAKSVFVEALGGRAF